MSQKQHVDIHRKLLLRRNLLRHALPGAAYVPFVGDGDIALELYNERQIYAADIDPERVRTAEGRLAAAEIRVADCDSYPFPDIQEPIALADFDAYNNPYKALASFWPKARRTPRLVLFGTDGMRQAIIRNKITL